MNYKQQLPATVVETENTGIEISLKLGDIYTHVYSGATGMLQDRNGKFKIGILKDTYRLNYCIMRNNCYYFVQNEFS